MDQWCGVDEDRPAGRAMVTSMPKTDNSRRNADFPWGIFPSDAYHDQNYQHLRDDDREILARVGDFFQRAGIIRGRGIDVGTGTNLSPALAMLPFCRHISMWEISAANIDWLKKNTPSYPPNWEQFWSVLQAYEPYRRIRDPRGALHAKVGLVAGDVFRLPQRHWDIGTMFFVACSLSPDMGEFTRAVHTFIRSLKPNAPFAATFMEESEGYEYAGIRYPAVKVSKADVEQVLGSLTYGVEVVKIDTASPLRAGYEGMLLAVGRRDPADHRG